MGDEGPAGETPVGPSVFMAGDKKPWVRPVHRADKNQPDIVKDLRKFGVRVKVTSQVGDGFPDLVCDVNGVNVLLEVKQPGRRKLRPDQEEFHALWTGPCYVVESSEEAIKVLASVALANRPAEVVRTMTTALVQLPRWTPEAVLKILGLETGVCHSRATTASGLFGQGNPATPTRPLRKKPSTGGTVGSPDF